MDYVWSAVLWTFKDDFLVLDWDMKDWGLGSFGKFIMPFGWFVR